MQTNELIETRNVKAVKSAVRKTVGANGFLAVVAEVGSGKTALFNHLTEFWHAQPRKFACVEIKSFRHNYSRVPSIMKHMIRSINPDLHIPSDIESRYEALRNALRQARRWGKHVILAIDEAQDMSLQTFRDLKKIHEIDGTGKESLFSIILFGKPHKTWETIYISPELGYRIQNCKLRDLTAEECILIAEQRFGLKFKDQNTKARFAAAIQYKTPLGVRFVADTIRFMSDEENPVVTPQRVKDLPWMTVRMRMKQSGTKINDVLDKIKAERPELRISRQRVSEVLNGKRGSLTDGLSDIVMQYTELAIGDRLNAAN